MDTNKDKKNEIFKIIQEMLKEPPVIIWGSGATIPYGMPSMKYLNKTLGEAFQNFDGSSENLEVELGKDKYRDIMPEIRKNIWNTVKEADIRVLKEIIFNDDKYNGIKIFIEKFINAHPKVLNIITTNYDCVLENVMSFNDISFTDGFNGRNLSLFDETSFKEKDIVNLLKVHGSLNWFDIDDKIHYYVNNDNDDYKCVIIPPGKNKYQEVHKTPYRELIQKSDNIISKANSLLVIGFGFNDEHLTPKIKNKVKCGCPIVIITKEITNTTEMELKDAKKYIFLEEYLEKDSKNKTKVRIKEREMMSERQEILEDSYWSLNKFMEII